MWYNDFLRKVTELRNAKDIDGSRLYDMDDVMDIFGFESRGEFWNKIKEAQRMRRRYLAEKVKVLKDRGHSCERIACVLGISESSVRLLQSEYVQSKLVKTTSGVTQEEIQRVLDILGEEEETFVEVEEPAMAD